MIYWTSMLIALGMVIQGFKMFFREFENGELYKSRLPISLILAGALIIYITSGFK